MKILVSTMGKHLEIGCNLLELLKKKISFEMIGFLVANSKYYKEFNKNSELRIKNHELRIANYEICNLLFKIR